MEMLLAAPGLFPIPPAGPSRSASHGATIRDTISAPPPGGNPTTDHPAQGPPRIGFRAYATWRGGKRAGRAGEMKEATAGKVHGVPSLSPRRALISPPASRR